jgi:hypothetical protein
MGNFADTVVDVSRSLVGRAAAPEQVMNLYLDV